MFPDPSPTKAMRRAGHRTQLLLDGEEVGQHLHRVSAVGEPVDDRDRAPADELLQPCVGGGPHHHRVGVAGDDPRGVGERLAPGELAGAGAQLDGVAAELERGRGERQPGPGAGLLHQEHHASSRPACPPAAPRAGAASAAPPGRRGAGAPRRSRSRHPEEVPHREPSGEAGEELRQPGDGGRSGVGARRPPRGARQICRSTCAGRGRPRAALARHRRPHVAHRGERGGRAPGPGHAASSWACISPSPASLRLAHQRAHPPVGGPERAPRPHQRLGHVGGLGVSPAPARPGSVRRRSGCGGWPRGARRAPRARWPRSRAAAPRSSWRSRL